MSDQLAVPTETQRTADSEIAAEVAWTVSSRPPEVVLSFQGLHEPVELWTELQQIGWIIPAMPPRPANAIEWTPDPVAGTDFTVLPWTVTEFRLEEGAWSVPADEVGTRTLDALLDHQGKIIGTSDQIAAHANAYATRAKNPIRPPKESVAAPAQQPVTQAATTQPNPLLREEAPAPAAPAQEPASQPAPAADSSSAGVRNIILTGIAAEDDPLPSPGVWIGISGRTKTECEWSETAIGLDQPIPGLSQLIAKSSNDNAAWFVDTSAALPERAPAGSALMRLILPGLSENDAKVRRLNKVLGADVDTFQLRSLTDPDATAVLVSTVVGANSFEMLKSNLCLRLPTAIIRVSA